MLTMVNITIKFNTHELYIALDKGVSGKFLFFLFSHENICCGHSLEASATYVFVDK